MGLPIILAVAVTILGLYYYFTKEQNPFEKHGLPYKQSIPLLGSSWSAMLHLKPFATMVQDIYNMAAEARYVGFYHRMAPVVMLRDPELIKSVAIKNFDHFPDHRTFTSGEPDPFFSSNLLLLRGDRWKEVRSLLTPAFTSSKLKAMFVLMSECATNIGQFLASLPADQRTIEMKDVFTRYTNDVFASCAFGINVDSMIDRENKFYAYGREALDIHSIGIHKIVMLYVFPRLAKRLGIRFIRKEVLEFFESVVSANIAARDETGIFRPDLIQLMMESRGKLGPGKELTIEDMTSQAFAFFFGGFETTSSLLCFAVHELAVNRGIQERLQREIDQVMCDSNGEVTYEMVNEMKYLDAVVNEALRLYPVIPITDRQCVKEIELPPATPGTKPFLMKEGSYLWLPIYAIQRDPKYFDQPEKFDPSRFLDRQGNILHSGAYLPFGMGPRICIGYRFALVEAKVGLFHILARCKLDVCSETQIPMKLGKAGAFLKAEKGFWLQVRPRNNPFTSVVA
ncbi:cytochrome P450 9e2-like [Hylaeus volcanicus]|uniref:cytochrome P450 9e2-like n=1 Tax=Hylaeus volcanicus TaxID=313075 RepID=UPI0023B7EF4A|nr:cytochrome P450 9e2-like [Hylaeus volcanicus]